MSDDFEPMSADDTWIVVAFGKTTIKIIAPRSQSGALVRESIMAAIGATVGAEHATEVEADPSGPIN